MAKKGLIGNGARVAYSISSPLDWVEITQVLDVKIPVMQTDKVENTVHSTTSNLKTHMPGLSDVSDMTITLLTDQDPDTSPEQEALWGFRATQETIWWRYELPVNRSRTVFRGAIFEGWVGSMEPGSPIADKQTLNVMVNFDGAGLFRDADVGASQLD